jgi:predicted ATPase
MFKNLTLFGWRQFRRAEIDFHPRLTVLTGANGAGKTTLLNLVSRHFGWRSQFISTPRLHESKSSSGIFYSTDYWDLDDQAIEDGDKSSAAPVGPQRGIGSIAYGSGATTGLSVRTDNAGSSYDVQLANQQQIEGLHIPSHRPTYSYQQVQNIPTVPRRRNEAYKQYLQLLRARYQGEHTQWSPQYYLKETLIALATFGYGNIAVEPDAESVKIFEDFQNVLRRMLPPKLGFRRLVVRVPEVVLETDTGSFSIDAISGGAAAVIELAWQIFMYQPAGTAFVVTLDEPENHLHPELQRRVLADLLAAFPHVQFIVATHSPFIVGSVPYSNVYVLDYDEGGRVSSSLLDTVNRAGSANEILREVLGLDFTMPVWVESELEALVQRYEAMPFTNETVAELRREMSALGLAKLAPQTIARLADQKSGPQ